MLMVSPRDSGFSEVAPSGGTPGRKLRKGEFSETARPRFPGLLWPGFRSHPGSLGRLDSNGRTDPKPT